MDKFSLFFENDSRSFLRSIFQNPFEPTGKLVFADWLQEEGKVKEAELMRLAAQYQQNGSEWPSQKSSDKFHYLVHELERYLGSKNIQTVSNRVKHFKAFDYYQLTPKGVEYYTPDQGLVPIDLNEVPEDILEGIIYHVAGLTAPFARSEHWNTFEHGLVALNVGLLDGLSRNGVREIYSGIRSMFLAMRHDEDVAKNVSPQIWNGLKDRIRSYIESLNSYSNNSFVSKISEFGISVKDLIIDLKVLLKELPNS